MTTFWDIASCGQVEIDRLSEVCNALVMEAARTSETSVYFNETTLRYIPESCLLYARCRENLNSHNINLFVVLHVDGARLRVCLRTAATNGPIVLSTVLLSVGSMDWAPPFEPKISQV
jgi:hypothetical protein